MLKVSISLAYSTLVFTPSNVEVCQESATFSPAISTYVLIVYITIPDSQQSKRNTDPDVLSTSVLLEILENIIPAFEATTGFTVTNVEGVDRPAQALKLILIIAGAIAAVVIFTVVACVVFTIVVAV